LLVRVALEHRPASQAARSFEQVEAEAHLTDETQVVQAELLGQVVQEQELAVLLGTMPQSIQARAAVAQVIRQGTVRAETAEQGLWCCDTQMSTTN
jgi:hypothetical protein